MKTIFFDTETTGLSPGQICQLSYIITDEEKTIGKNFFFTVGYIEPGAYKIHKYTVQELTRLANGFSFRHHCGEIYSDFLNINTAVAHNIDFDINFLKIELSRCGYTLKVSHFFCCMKRLTGVIGITGIRSKYKYPSLKELVKFLTIEEKDISRHCRLHFGADKASYHDARYDATAVMLCYQRIKERDII